LFAATCAFYHYFNPIISTTNATLSSSLKYKLPFPDNTFNFVRLANLNLCVPYAKWTRLLREVRRVLAPHGRLEFIEDVAWFPYGKPPTSSTHLSARRCSSGPRSGFDDDGDDNISNNRHNAKAQDKESLDEGIDMTEYPDPVLEWNDRKASSERLEEVFESMIENKYKMYPRPARHMPLMLKLVFGETGFDHVTTKQLFLASQQGPTSPIEPETDSDKSSFASTDSGFASASSLNPPGPKIRWKFGKGKKPEPSSPDEPLPNVHSAKAAAILGLPPQSPPTTLSRVQSPGLFLYPSTFIPLTPSALEMHVCKHMHVLLGCKAALKEYAVRGYLHGPGFNHKRIPADKFEDMIWDYEWLVVNSQC
jgi:hypothetical protein